MGTDGPSAGVAMTLALISAYKKKKIRQDVAVTGEINLAIEGKIFITPIGGTHEKIMAAQKRGFKKVCIPERNYINDIIPSDYMLKVVSCKTLQDYMREVFED
jgi:ATP-dependent Lon protease